MANPFGEALSVVGEGVANFAFPNTLARRRERKETAAMREAFSQSLQSMPPQVQETLRPFMENDEAFGELLENPQLLSNLGTGAAAVNPPPAEIEGDDILTLFGRGEQFAQQGDTRRAELMLSAAADEAGIDMSQQSGTPGPFGSGFKGSSYNLVNAMAPAAFTGELDDEQGRLLDSALAAVLQPVQVRNPVTGQQELIEPTIAPWMRQLAEQRGVTPGAAQGEAQGAQQPGTAPAVDAEGAAPQIQQPAGEGAEPTESVFAALPSGSSLFDQANNLTGPIDSLQRTLSGFTGLGGLTGEQTGAAQLANFVTEELVDSFRTLREVNSRAMSETTDLRERFGFSPEALGNETNFRERAAQVRLEMERVEDNVLSQLPEMTSVEQKKRNLDALVRVRSLMDRVSPPVLQSAQDIQEFIANNAPETEFVMRDPDAPGNPWIKVRVKGKQ